MIIDRIENIGRYAQFIKDCDKLAAFFQNNPVQTLSQQKYAIEDTEYTFTPVIMDAKPSESKRWEGHRRHTDIHLVVKGRECLEWIPLDRMEHPADYNEEADVEFYSDTTAGTRLLVDEGYFALFLPEDIHKPLITQDGCVGLKVLIKTDA